MVDRRLVLAIVLAGCTSSHTTVSARTDCSACHTAPALTDPVAAPCRRAQDHSTYPATCYQCHGTTQWCPAVPADKGHPELDITTPSHAGWDCADCHPTISYAPPTLPVLNDGDLRCTTCHWHSKDRTDPNHLGNGDYTYGSDGQPQTCYQAGCHGPGGKQ